MAPRRENLRRKGKEIHPEEHEQRTKARLDLPLLESPALMTRYKKIFSKKSIIWGRTFNFRDSSYVKFPDYIEKMGWSDFCSLRETGYSRLVRGFYACANISRGQHAIYGSLKGIDFEITEQLLAELFHIPMGGYKFPITNSWPTIADFEPQQALLRVCSHDSFQTFPPSGRNVESSRSD